MKTFLGRNWFLIGLITVLVFGVANSGQLQWFANLQWFRNFVVAAVMFVTTLPVNLATIRTTCAKPGPALLATAVAYLFIPLITWPVSRLFSPEIQLGFMVAAVAPTTLATAAVWTRRAGGNDVVPILTTMITNISCFAVAPLWLWLTTTSSTSIELPLGSTMWKLFLLVVLPMIVGQALRRSNAVADWATERKPQLSIMAQAGVLIMVLIGSIQCGAQLSNESVAPSERAIEMLGMSLAVAVIHMVALWFTWNAAHRLGFARPDAIGAAFAGSQKTLMVGLQLALLVGGGFAILPLFVYHFFQLTFDTFVSDRWRKTRPNSGIHDHSENMFS